MTEERKHAILFAATLLCARKMVETMESDKPNFAEEYWVDNAVIKVAFILERIDKKFPEQTASGVTARTARGNIQKHI